MSSGEKEQKRISRREFVKGAAVGAAGVAAAGALASCTTAATPEVIRETVEVPVEVIKEVPVEVIKEVEVQPWLPKKWDKEADVVVVGYGGAGACAAIVARDAGAEVVILEKRDVPGGATAVCGGVIYAANTSVQEANGIEDSADKLYQHYLNAGKDFIDPELARIAADKAADNIEWIIGLGAEFPNPPSVSGAEAKVGSEPIARVHRIYYGDLVGGPAFFQVLADAAEARGAEILMETPGKQLLVDADGAVVGVKAESEGKEIYVKARKAVVLTAGGFTRNKEMLAAYTIAGFYGQPLTPPGLTGDGHRMGLALGADVLNMSKVVGIPGLTLPGAVSATYAPAGTSIFLNLEGRRFMDEFGFYDVKAIELLEQTESRCFAVFDDAMREAGAGSFLFDSAPELVFQADTLAELAGQINIDPAAVEAAIATWNADAEAGVDSQFGRTRDLDPIATPPFFAFETIAAVFDTVGGLKINTEAQVVNVWGDVIPRLYAAGVNTGGLVGEFYPGSGTALNTTILTFGRIAGKNAAAEESRA